MGANPAATPSPRNAPPHGLLELVSCHCGPTRCAPVLLAFFLFLGFDKLVPIVGNLGKPLCLLSERLFTQTSVWLAASHHSGSSFNVTFPEITPSKVAPPSPSIRGPVLILHTCLIAI